MLTANMSADILLLIINRRDSTVPNKQEVLPGTLNLLVLKTLATLGPLHGYGIARRIEQVSGDLLEVNQGTLYPALLKLEQMGWIRAKWSVSDNNRRAKYYSLTAAGKKQLRAEEEDWQRTSAIVSRFLAPAESNQ
jgi:PadR family transcriptional regulator PadR